MTLPSVRAIIEKAYPGARILEDVTATSDARESNLTPAAKALIEKWAGPDHNSVVAVRIQRPTQQHASAPMSARSRTVLVDIRAGKVIGEQG